MTASVLTEQDYSALVERYRRLREISYKLHGRPLLDHLSQQAFPEGGKKLGMLGGGTTLRFDSEDDLAILADYCLYDLVEENGNAIARYRAGAHPDPTSDESALLHAMSESFYTLIEVTEVVPGVGVRVADLFAGRREYLLIDMGLGRTAQKGGILASRLFPVPEFVMSSGAGLLVDADTLHRIRTSVLPQHGTEQDGQCLLAGGRQKAADLAAAIIRLCRRSQVAENIRYEDVGAESIAAPLRPEATRGPKRALPLRQRPQIQTLSRPKTVA